MSDREPHCPFLNRADHRCSSFFSIEQLQHAFEHCFHAYKTCSVYQELLVERQARRSRTTGGRFLWTTACVAGDPAGSQAHGRSSSTASDAAGQPNQSSPFVQIRIHSLADAQGAAAGAHGYAKPVA